MSCRVPHEGRPRRFSVVLLTLFFATLSLSLAHGAAALTVNSLGDFDNVTVMEVSGNYDAVDSYGRPDMAARRAIAREFYRSHGDDYDFLVIFTNFDFRMPSLQAKAFFSPAKNDVRGIGLALNDYTYAYSPTGSFLSRLQGTIDMANIAGHVLEPAAPEFDDTLLTLSHEMLHRWGAYVRFRDGGETSEALLGFAGAHWSFLLDAGGSTLYGNNWQDNGDGTFTSVAPEQARSGEVIGRIFSPLDLYLMGLVDKSQVAPMLLIDSPGLDRSGLPAIGVTIPGTAKSVTIDDIIAVEGERLPSAADTRKEFRIGFIYAVTPGSWSGSNVQDRGDLAAINRLQTEWEKRFSILTGGLGLMRTVLVIPESMDTNPDVPTPTMIPAETPGVNNGVAWLVSRQKPDGSWQDQSGTYHRDTAAAVMALKVFPDGLGVAASGQAWLGSVTPENSDFLARKLLGLSSVNVTEMAALQNADGGWGSAPGYRSNPHDTALALQVLAVHGGAGNEVLTTAVNYLHDKQLPDGGWGVGPGGGSVQATAQVLLAMNSYRASYALEPAIVDGCAWLAARQNADGGFGNSPGTVQDTAVALQALKTAGVSPSAVSGAIDYLLARQANNGSWNDSVFQTAQAVRALHAGQVAADLAIEAAGIVITPATVAVVPSNVTITATVRNLGSNPVAEVKVSLYAQDPATGDPIAEKIVNVAGNGSVPVNFAVTVGEFGLLSYYIVIDGDNRVAEANEWNNMAFKTLAVNLPPPTVGFDLAASAGSEAQGRVSLTLSLSYPWPEPITVNYAVNPASTAVSSSDYLRPAGPLTFAADQTSRTIDLTVINDLVAEVDKSVIIELAAPSLGTLGTSRHTYTIRDDEVPAVNIVSPPSGLIGQTSPLLLYATTGSSVVVKVDGAVVSKVSGSTLEALADGPHSVAVTAGNSYGLVATSMVEFVIDTELPTVIIDAPKGVQTTSTPRLAYLIDGAEAVEVKVDGVVVNTISGQYLDPLTEGSHTLTVTATNALGRSNLATSTFTVDTLPPSITLVYPYNGGVLEESSPLLLYTPGENGTVTVRVDGVVVPKVSGDRLGPLSDGEHAVTVTLTDGNGVSAETAAVFVVELDAETPRVTAPDWSPPSRDLWRRTDVAVGEDGHVYMAGMTTGSYDLFLAKYDRRGALVWSKVPWVASMDTDANALGVDAAGNVYVAFTAFDGIGGYPARAGRDVYLAKFGSDGTRLGLMQIASGHDDYVYDMFVSGSGEVYLAGVTGGSLFYGSSGGYSTWVARYDSSLSLQWGDQRTHSSYYDPENCFITVTADGMVYVAGRIQGRFDGSGTQLGLGDYYLASWDSFGIYRGVVQGGTTQSDNVYGLGADAFGSVYLLGTTQGAFSGYASSGLGDYFLVKFAADSQLQWLHQWGTAASDEPSALEVEPDGDLYVLERRNLTKFDRNKKLIWSDQKLTSNSFDEGGAVMDRQGNLFAVYAGSFDSALYKYTDPRLPYIAIEVAGLTREPSVALQGTRQTGAEVLLTTKTGAACDSIRYPSATTWTCVLSGLHEGANQIEAIARSTEGFRNSARATVDRDASAPNIVLHLPVGGATYGEKPTVSYQIIDDNPGEAVAYLNGRRILSIAQPLEGLLSGANVLMLVATDRAGNRAAVEVTFYAEGAAVGERPFTEEFLEQFGSSGNDSVDQVVKDKSGNIYMTGTTYGDLDGQLNQGLADAFVRKYDPAGKLLWTRLIGTGQTEAGKGIAIDDAGNILLLYQVDYVSVKGSSSNWSDVVVAKYDASFNLVWSRQIGSSARDYAIGLCLDAAGNVYVAGNTEGSIDRRIFKGPSDYFLVAYDGLGNQLWMTQSSKDGGEKLRDMTIREGGGYLYLVGSDVDGEPFYMTWSLSGTWGDGPYRFYLARGATPAAIAVDSEGGIYVTGRLRSADGLSDDVFVHGPKWAHEFGSGGYDSGLGLVFDRTGHLFILGTVDRALETAVETGDQEIMAAKFSKDGGLKWLTQFGTAGNEEAVGAVVDQTGTLLVAGTTTGEAAGPNSGKTDVFMTRMTAALGPFLSVDPPQSPTRLSSQVLTGKTTTTATLTVEIAFPGGSAATLSPVIQYPDGAWECTVNNLTVNADNGLTITATDPSGSAIRTLTIAVDTLPPLLAMNPVTSPTGAGTQLISGTIEDGAGLSMIAGSSPLPTTIAVSNGAWNYAASLQTGENVLSFTATDKAGNVTVRSAAITYEPPQMITTIVVTKASYDARKKMLNIEATSTYKDAQLQVDGYGPMIFSRLFKGKYYWTFTKSLAAKPAMVTVSGPEGAVTALVQ